MHCFSDFLAFKNLSTKLGHWLEGYEKKFALQGINEQQFNLFLSSINESKSTENTKPILLIYKDEETAEASCQHLKTAANESLECLFYPGLSSNPYLSAIDSEYNLFLRFAHLKKLLSPTKKRRVIFTTLDAALLRVPTSEFFAQSYKVAVSDIVGPEDLAQTLVALGYQHATTVEEPGTFSSKGEIFDVFPNGAKPIRLHYFDEMIEEIFEMDINTGKTLRDKPVEFFDIPLTPLVFASGKYKNVFRQNIPQPLPGQKLKHEKRNQILHKISNHSLFENYPIYVPYFLEKTECLFTYLNYGQVYLVNENEIIQNISEYFEDLRLEFESSNNDPHSDLILKGPSTLFVTEYDEILNKIRHIAIENIGINLNTELEDKVELQLIPFSVYIRKQIEHFNDKYDFLKKTFQFLHQKIQRNGIVVFTYKNENSLKEINFYLESTELNHLIGSKIFLVKFELTEGFYYNAEDLFFISDADLFSIKKKKSKKRTKKSVDLFAEQLATLKDGDYIIHKDHGVGRYLGLETMTVGGNTSDFLVIEYHGNDKIYLPVHKMDLIQKHSDGAQTITLTNLKTKKFDQAKSRAKESAKKLAFDLLKLQAERNSTQSFAYSPSDHEFKDFELSFPFEETEDQLSAIDDVIQDMEKTTPMDRLVCGDVGFGKTEIAIRAAYKAALDNKQVAVLVPTTILCLQHYNSFLKRFKDFPVNIEFLSRLKTPKQVKEIKSKLANGHIDIIIGTHKLLAKDIEYKDLGLVVIDEEQRFGVAHKEKFKLLKSTVDFLTLTATPIPRTLQLSFLGIRDLSLIKSAPHRRQSIKSYIIKEDPNTIKSAIEKEILRGGQVFFVHNRVNNIEKVAANLKELIPQLRIVIAHGQLPERELEKRMSAFYNKEYDLLLATTIIESGIDIPSANTMIINRSDRFGLSQLHQLRGRIGRSDKKAYAYFVIPNERNITPEAERRLKALQMFADLGSGFNIASSDLEIRGAGDILGAEQSGHIDCIGLELYMDLLKEAIREIKGEKKAISSKIEITSPFAAYIPNHYINDHSTRLKYYKRLSNTLINEKLEDYRSELFDIYGALPQEINNLLSILAARNILNDTGISSLSFSGKKAKIKFNRQILDQNELLRNSIIQYFMSKPKKYKINPDYSIDVILKTELTPPELINFSSDIASQIAIC